MAATHRRIERGEKAFLTGVSDELERFHFRSGATGGLSARVSGRTGSKLPVAPDGEKVKPL
jgi:hypothetical protein